MKKRYLLLSASLLVFSGCSFSTPKNKWQLNSIGAYESYKQYFLQGKDNLANAEIKRARDYAKQSADLSTLARIDLSECALHVSVLEDMQCSRYDALKNIVSSHDLSAYEMFLQNRLSQADIESLPAQYRSFAGYVLNKEFTKAQESVFAMDDVVSMLISASLIKEHLSKQNIKEIIEKSSFYGYKKAVVSWIEFYLKMDIDQSEKEKMEKTLKVMTDSK